MTSDGLRLLQDLRRGLLEPPRQLPTRTVTAARDDERGSMYLLDRPQTQDPATGAKGSAPCTGLRQRADSGVERAGEMPRTV
jgi:hypothetical protein